MQNFYLIRHGETDWNVKLGKLQGHTDIPLNDQGIRQAKALPALNKDFNISKVISSDLVRARVTAEHLTDFQKPVETTPELREVHLGIGEGMKWEEVDLKLGSGFRAQWSSNQETHMDMRFPEGESRREVIERVKKCLKKFLQKNPKDTLAFVTHGFVIRTLVFHIARLETNFFVPNCAIVPFAFDGDEMIYKGPEAPELLLQPRLED